MLTYVVMLGVLIVAVMVFIKPKWGSFLAWPILFIYPHNWWYQRQFLPMNMGADDLFCVGLFLIVVFRRNLMEGRPVRFGYAFWGVTAFVLVAVMANLAGAMEAVGEDRLNLLKDILKFGVYWALFYSILHCIDNKRDLHMQFITFSLGATAGAILVILQYSFPGRFEHWSAPIALERGIVEGGRATGAFLNANSAACVLTCSIFLVAGTMQLRRARTAQIIFYASIAVLLIGVLLTRSRAGLLALVGAFSFMIVFSPQKKLAVLVLVAAVGVGVMFPVVRGEFAERVAKTYNPRSGLAGGNVKARLAIWRSYFETADTRDYLFGKGSRRGIQINGGEAHSTYVSLITVYGAGGVIWAGLTVLGFRKKAKLLSAAHDPQLRIMASACTLSLIAWCFYGITADAVSAPYPRYVLFYLIVLIDRASFIARCELAAVPPAQSAQSTLPPLHAQPA